MVQGLDTREIAKDINVDKGRVNSGPNAVPLSPVRSPNPSSFSKVGSESRALADVLGSAAGMLDKYYDRKRDEDRIRGSILRSQGMAIEEAEKEGSDVGTGWRIADLKIQADTFLANERHLIETGAYKLSPEDYSKQLQAKFKEIKNALPNNIPVLNKYIAAFGEQTFSTLAAEQIKARNDYNYTQTEIKAGAMINSTLDVNEGQAGVDAVQDFLNPESLGLKPEDHMAMLADTATFRLSNGDPRLAHALMGLNKGTPTANATALAMSVAPPGVKETVKELQPTLAQKADMQDKLMNNMGLQKALGLPVKGTADYTHELDAKDRVFDYVASEMNGVPELIFLSQATDTDFVDEWAERLGTIRGKPSDPRKGEISVDQFLQMAGDGGDEHMNRIKFVQDAMKSYKTKSATAYKNLDSTGSLLSPGALKTLNTSYKKYLKDVGDQMKITKAVQSNTLNMLKPQEQASAFNMIKAEVTEQVMRELPMKQGETPEDYQERASDAFAAEYAKRLAMSTATDKVLASQFESTLNPANMVDPDTKKISDNAVDSLRVLSVMEKNMPDSVLSDYIPKDSEDVVRRALAAVQYGGDMRESLRQSLAIEQDVKDGVVKKYKTPQGTINKLIDEKIDKTVVGLYRRFAPKFLGGDPTVHPLSRPFSPDYTIEGEGVKDAFKNTVNGRRTLHQVAALAEVYNQTLNNPEAATTKAWAEVEKKMTFMFDQPVTFKGDPDEWLGLPSGTVQKYPGLWNKALSRYLKDTADYSVFAPVTNLIDFGFTQATNALVVPLIGMAAGIPDDKIEAFKQQRLDAAIERSESPMFFGKEYSTYWGQDGNNMFTAAMRGTPSYKNITPRLAESEDAVYIMVNDPKTGLPLSSQEMRVPKAYIKGVIINELQSMGSGSLLPNVQKIKESAEATPGAIKSIPDKAKSAAKSVGGFISNTLDKIDDLTE